MRRYVLLPSLLLFSLVLAGCFGGGPLVPVLPPDPPVNPGELGVIWGVEHYPLNPTAGQPIEFCVWWINPGPPAVATIDYNLSIDGVEVESGSVSPFVIATESGRGHCTSGTFLASPTSVYSWSVAVKWGATAGEWLHVFESDTGVCWPGECGIKTRREKFW